ncbi:31220_t:CDS:2, partial [Racocetra persica]
ISSSIYHFDTENLHDIIAQDNPINDPTELEDFDILNSFSKLIEEACQIENFYNSYDNMQFNKRMCRHLGRCIIKAVSEVKLLQNQTDYEDFLTLDNYKFFLNFLQDLKKIKNFIENISQIRRLKSFIQETDDGISFGRLKNECVKLLEKFHESTSSLGFNIQIDDKTDNIHKDIEETKKAFECNFEDDSMFNFIKKISARIQNDMRLFCVRIALLKNLKGLANISNFYDTRTKLKFALEICNALVFLNAVNFLHRDIKSENILITNDRKAKITNFCQSRLVTDESGILATKIA